MAVSFVFTTLAFMVIAADLEGAECPPPPNGYYLPYCESPSRLGVYPQAAVSTDSAVCAPVGKRILQMNGSAVDAAIATSLCMGAVNPESSGIGGGFSMVIYQKGEQKSRYLDNREPAPRKVTEDMYKENPELAKRGGLSIAIPTEILGYHKAHSEFGRLPWKTLFEPTIRMCKEGISVTPHLASKLWSLRKKIKAKKPLRRIFVDNTTKEVLKEGDMMYMPDLAVTLQKIADDGIKALYDPEHPTAQQFMEDLKKMGSIIDAEDLTNYKPRFLDVVTAKLTNNLTSHTASTPASGVLVTFMLNILNGYNPTSDVAKSKESAITFLHRMIESFKFAFAKRRLLEDDVEAMKPVIEKLISKAYADKIRARINDSTTFSDYKYYAFDNEDSVEDHGTAHLSIVSQNGDAVALTTTINTYFGSLEMSPSTGILLNNHMADFSIPSSSYHPKLNRIRPGRKPLSSTTPTIVVDSNNNPRLVIGGAGATRILTAVVQVMLRNLFLEEDIKRAIDAPRFHHRLRPDEISCEKNFPKDLRKELRKKGHKITESAEMAVVMGITRGEDGRLYANADDRKKGDVDGF